MEKNYNFPKNNNNLDLDQELENQNEESLSDNETEQKDKENEKENNDPAEKSEPIYKTVSFFRLQYALSTKKDNLIMMLGLLGSLGLGLSMPLFSIIYGNSLNSFGNPMGSSDKLMKEIGDLCLKFLFIGLGMWVSAGLMIWMWGYNGKTIAKKIKEKYFQLILNQEQGWFDSENVNEFSTKLQTQIKIIEMGVSS